jgi:hypothetical protein
MKKLILASMIVGFGAISFGQTQKPAAKKTAKPATTKEVVKEADVSGKPITFTNMVLERQDIPKGTNDIFVFEFKNTGKTPLLIQNVQTSCGCTTANKPEAPVAPGQKAEISVKYDTQRVGAFEKTITITTNAQSEPIVLTIKGSVLAQ